MTCVTKETPFTTQHTEANCDSTGVTVQVHDASSTEPTPKPDLQIFGDYVASQLKGIRDEELLNEAQYEINKILYETKRRWLGINLKNK